MAAERRQLTPEQKEAMKAAAARKREEAKKEIAKALAGKSEQEQKLYMVQLQKEELKKRMAKLEMKTDKLSGAADDRKKRNRIIMSLGIALLSHYRTMPQAYSVLQQFRAVADSFENPNKREQRLKDDIMEGLAMIMAEGHVKKPAPAQAPSQTVAESK
jgi:signal recognition particle GTPase